MSRKFKSFEQYLKPDPKFDNVLVSKFVNCLMHGGKKSVAQRVFYEALDLIQQRFPKEKPIDVFITAVNNVKPQVEVRSRRVGGASYQVPMAVTSKRQTSLAIRWILGESRKKKGKPMAQLLADEFSDAYKKEGASMKKRDTIHRMAEANKAFAHFAWGR